MLYVPPLTGRRIDDAIRLLFPLHVTKAEWRRIERYLLFYRLGQYWLNHH